ncbi:hypothetical protein PPL_10730 [Heterostelium album PN500]|uniref:Uncharacterized protein n=1 Tax=Heterostelium pallidum (strain ATCC 26659 / Pp 5 / PN500) TaxID=670386 RepID=D3BRW7_HETP5|nr:hypothetical protein PPL_10730 [Heterostelium album PN500]EFA76149.1 hypothetical protein PPL_10730 [Heterostelium album PN500]|eukprot:XP_020428283.1 hypothetical protein PPL_10730 [Heterostelium album PN500]
MTIIHDGSKLFNSLYACGQEILINKGFSLPDTFTTIAKIKDQKGRDTLTFCMHCLPFVFTGLPPIKITEHHLFKLNSFVIQDIEALRIVKTN